MNFIKNPYFLLITFILLSTPHFSFSIRPDTDDTGEAKQTNHKGAGDDDPSGGYFPGGGFGDIPGFGKGWPGNGIVGGGYGGGYGGPNGGHAKSGIIRPSTVCKEVGPCFKKKVICPAKCFTSYSRSGKNFGGGGGGGSCTIDCKKNCIAYC